MTDLSYLARPGRARLGLLSRGLALLGLEFLACAPPGPTRLVLDIQSDLKIPDEITDIEVVIRSAEGEKVLDNLYPLQGPEAVTLPGRIGLDASEASSGPLDIQVVGKKAARPVVLKSVTFALQTHATAELRIELARDCLGILCPKGLSCTKGGRCEDQLYGRRPIAGGAPCNCFHLLPQCVGAWWAYDEFSNGVRVTTYKKQAYAAYGPVGDPRHDKQDVRAFLQVRPSVLDFSQKWLSSFERGDRTTYWEKEVQFNKQLALRSTTYHVPRKIRLAEGLTAAADAPFEERYAEIQYLEDGTSVIVENLDKWSVMPTEDVLRLSGSNFPMKYTRGNVICHHKVGSPVKVTPPEKKGDYPETDKIFCYVRGVGKVYEASLKSKMAEEVLADYDYPGKCAPVEVP